GASAALPAAESLAAELETHARTLGLDDDQPRLGTSRIITALLHRLAATTDPAQTLRLLAGAELARENAIYAAHLATAETLAGALRGRNWQVLDQFAASGDDPEGAAIIAVLQRA